MSQIPFSTHKEMWMTSNINIGQSYFYLMSFFLPSIKFPITDN